MLIIITGCVSRFVNLLKLLRSNFLFVISGSFGEKAYVPYEKSQTEIPPGKRGWGVSGKLDLDRIRKMVRSKE